MSGGGRQQPRTTDAEDAAAAAEEARKKAEAEAAAKAAAEKAAWDAKLGSSYNDAVSEATKFFTDRGIDPAEYLDEIRAAATKAKGVVPQGANDPSTFFDGIGEDVYGDQQDLARNNFMRAFSTFAPANFETRKIADTADDDIVNSIDAEARGTADQFLQNLLDRGVINSAGYAGGARDLENQGYKARAKLNEVSAGALQEGRTKIGNIANSGRSAASNFNLGEQFDPYDYSTDINNALQEFFNGLGGNIRGRLTGPLYSTAGLPGVAGASMGAQNFRFDPNALAGVFDDEEDDTTQTSSLSAF